jgi:threonine/homoserine/homoserine lactone efflux protein
METGAKCGCNHSLAVICGVFAAIAVALVLAPVYLAVAAAGRRWLVRYGR